ncbi:MAG: hypothetical protein L3J09_10700 [Flavobacteriaceae bacterium]|nr:hypothetical protein [Flavobacteriaceae bacterium]
MKNSKHSLSKKLLKLSLVLVVSILLFSCENTTSKEKKENVPKEEVVKVTETLWRLKTILPDGNNLEIKAIDTDGKMYDVNAIQNSDQDSFLDIEAFVNNKRIPIKMLLNDDKYAPVKAIDKGGISYDIKAITPDGEKLDVKGVKRFGNIVSIKAITKEGTFYGVKAISPSGKLNDVKGVKINIKDKEMTLNGFGVFAHVKAIHQSDNDYEGILNPKEKLKKTAKGKKKSKKKDDFKNIIWNIKAVTKDGKNLKVKAFDEEGNQFDVKAIQDSGQYSFMNIKAIVNDSELPIKVIVSEEEYAPVIAISRDGANYTIKAIAEDGTQIDVKGISRSGNIINLKAVTENGVFYAIKAFSPKGKLNDVKGIKIFDRETEMTLRGNKVYAHVKAITQ